MTGELKAGLFVLAAIAALVYMTTRLTQNEYSFRGVKTYHAYVSDAAGLLSKTKVKMSGLDVGQLDTVELIERKARVTFQIAADIKVKKDASVAVKSIGFLGDKYLELYPGSEKAPDAEEGATLAESATGGGLEQLTAKTAEVMGNLKEITEMLREALKGDNEFGDGSSRLDRILDNMEQFSAGLASVDRLGDLADRLTEVAENVREVTSKVNRGDGTLGRLINDPETIEKINSTLSGVNKFINKADRMSVLFDARTGVLATTGGSFTKVSLMVQPTFDKYYLLGINTRPQGKTVVTRTETTQSPDAAGAAPSIVEEKETEEDGITFDAQFAKRWGDATFRVGLFESTGGIAADYAFLEDRVRPYAEIYRFKKGQDPQLNVGVTATAYKPFYLWMGGDHILNSRDRNFFVGGGVRFSDQDIKSLVIAGAGAAK
ncbi:MAG TPA: MlaD family protein [Oligoflexia bacterium]|nr:MlaD family protein [Oligoflexia bacterium]